MYNLPYFREKDESELDTFIRKYSFATICGSGPDGSPVATQVPLLIRKTEDGYRLLGHIMKQTDHHLAFTKNPAVLVLFTGPHCYISASWYTDPKHASTWNYMTVQMKGILHFLPEAQLIEILRETTAHYENDPGSPSLYDDLPEEYTGRLLNAIHAFEVEVSEVNHVFKLSQNRDEASYAKIISRLESGEPEAQAIAIEMKKRKNQLFNS